MSGQYLDLPAAGWLARVQLRKLTGCEEHFLSETKPKVVCLGVEFCFHFGREKKESEACECLLIAALLSASHAAVKLWGLWSGRHPWHLTSFDIISEKKTQWHHLWGHKSLDITPHPANFKLRITPTWIQTTAAKRLKRNTHTGISSFISEIFLSLAFHVYVWFDSQVNSSLYCWPSRTKGTNLNETHPEFNSKPNVLNLHF